MENIKEATHTHPSYSFAHYCEELVREQRDGYLKENFANPQDVFGPQNGCQGDCNGTGWVPVMQHDHNKDYREKWSQATAHAPSSDGWQMIPCSKCQGVHEELDEHIVNEGTEFVLKSKKSGKDVAKFKPKSLKEEYGGSDSQDNEREHDDAKKDSENSRETDLDKKQAAKKNREDKEKKRKEKKLLPYEFDNQHDAEKNAKHLGMSGSHVTPGGVYEPGASRQALRDAVAKKKEKQKQHSTKLHEEAIPVLSNLQRILKG